jgi:hypothetical protein
MVDLAVVVVATQKDQTSSVMFQAASQFIQEVHL